MSTRGAPVALEVDGKPMSAAAIKKHFGLVYGVGLIRDVIQAGAKDVHDIIARAERRHIEARESARRTARNGPHGAKHYFGGKRP